METKDYLTTIKRLQVQSPWLLYSTSNNDMCQLNQEENRKLSSSLTAATERDSGVSEDESYIEIDLVHKLQVAFDFTLCSYQYLIFQGTVEKQREQIRDLDSELSNIKADLEELKGQNDRLSTSNKVRKSLLTFVIILKSNTLGAPKKAATKPKPAPLPC